MYSYIKSLEITTKEFNIAPIGMPEIKLRFTGEFRPLENEINWSMEDDCSIKIKDDWLSIYNGINLVMEIYWPHLFRYTVNKDLKAGKMFTLEYRKHLRKLFSKQYFRVCFIGFEHETIETNYYLSAIHQAYAKARSWSRGMESAPGKGDRPLLVIAPYTIGDDFDTIEYKIIVDNREVECDRLTNDEADQKERLSKVQAHHDTGAEIETPFNDDMELVFPHPSKVGA